MLNGNRLNVSLDQKPATDFERLEDIGADAIRSARRAHAWCVQLYGDTATALAREIAELRGIVERRSALTVDGRTGMRLLRDALLDREDGVDIAVTKILADLHDAISASERVADLLAAERYVGHCRGIG